MGHRIRDLYVPSFAINIAYNTVQHDCTSIVEVGRHSIKEKLDGGLICTPCVETGG